MNKNNQLSNIKNWLLVAIFQVIATVTYAQIDVDIDLGKSEWYENPWVWVGVGAFLLILALIVRKK